MFKLSRFWIKLQSFRSDQQLFEKEISTQVFFCEYCKIFKKAYFEENLWAAASE